MSTGSAWVATCSAGPPTATTSFAVLDAYVEAGGNFIDTADSYMRPNMGISETIIGEWMAARGNRDSLVIATKVGSDGGLSAANIAQHVDGSLARLQTDRIDLYYAHKDVGDVPVEETVRAFDQTVRDGKVLHVAASNVPPDRLVESLELAAREGLAAYEWLQPHYNLLEREGYERDYAPIVERYGLSVAPYYALAAGFLTGKYRNQSAERRRRARAWCSQYLDDPRGERVLDALDEIALTRGVSVAAVAIDWLRAKPGIVAPIASARTVAQLGGILPTSRSTRARSPNSTRHRPKWTRHGRPSWTSSTRTGVDECRRALRNVEPETAELLGVLVRALGAQRVLEVGTSNGYSTIWLGDAVEAVGGSVVSVEIDPERTALAQDNLTQAGVDAFVEVRTQDAARGARGTGGRRPSTSIFLDAERREYASYWPDLVRVLRDRGLLVVGEHALARQGARRVLRARLLRRGRHLDAGHGRRGRAADRQVALRRYCCGEMPFSRLNAVESAKLEP